MKITILCVGKVKEKFYRDAIAEYSKRLSRYCKLEITEVSDEKTSEQATQTEIDIVKNKEGERLLKNIKDDAYVFCLAIDGKQLDSVELVDFAGTGIVVDGHDVGGRICLPEGFDDALTYDVVRQAAEGLGTYDVRYAFLDQLHHLTG